MNPTESRRDDGAVEQLLEPHRSGLQAHSYRMLGSAADAEDARPERVRGPQLDPDGQISAITTFHPPAAFPRFGLPTELHPEGAS